MNVGEIKAFQSEQAKAVSPEVALNRRLQEDGLKQASQLQQSFAKANQDISDNQKVAARVLSISINQSLTIEGRSADVTPKEKNIEKENKIDAQKKAPLFDFEEVARNVLNFVGSVINKAAANGAKPDELNSLFEQARSGVSKGIKMAEDELGTNATDEVKEGIAKSKSSIFDGIQRLENTIFDKIEENEAVKSTSNSYEKTELSEFSVRTRDGDTVTIQLGLRENVTEKTFADGGDVDNSNFIYQQTTNFSMQVKGELDDAELKAIGDLIAQADDLANTFYRGDIESAYQEALDIGFDNKELASFALQLTRVESSQKLKKYGEVQKYSESPSKDLKAPKAVADYVNKVLDAYSQSIDKLDSNEDFKAVINSIVNELKDIQVPDILSAINRFHTFNTKLLEAVESQQL